MGDPDWLGNFAQDVPVSIPMLYATSLYEPFPEEMSFLNGDSSVLMAFVQQPPLPQFHTPTMHPNLVSTLKSLIDADAFNDSGSNNITADPERDSNRRPEEENLRDEIATVSVDLIRNRRPFKCAHGGCNKTFKNPQTLKMHHKTHYSDDPAGSREASLEKSSGGAGRAGHNKKIPSRCPVCRRTFVGLYELRRHFGRKHSEGEKMHGCRKCGKRFYIEVDLRDHLKLCGEPIQCKCGMKFAFKCNLVAHKKSHPECLEYPDHCKSYSSLVSKISSSSSSSSGIPSIKGFPEMPFSPGGVKAEDSSDYSCCINGVL